MQPQPRQTDSVPIRTDLAVIHRLLEVLPTAAYTCDAEGLITYYNQLAAEVWGQEPKLNDPEYRFCGSFKLFSIGGSFIPRSQCWMALALQENKGYNEAEIVVERPDGSRRLGLIHANPFHDESGRVVGAVTSSWMLPTASGLKTPCAREAAARTSSWRRWVTSCAARWHR